MRKKTRKKAAIFLAAALVFQSGSNIFSAHANNMPDFRFEADAVGTIGNLGRSTVTGQVDVSLVPALFLKKAVTFQVNLTPVTAKVSAMNDTLTLAADTIKAEKVSFTGVPQGKYQLSVEAAGFAKFSQEIEVGAQGYTVNLTTGFLGGVNYAAGAAHPGVLLIGDVDGDGTIGETDLKALVNAIDNGIVTASDLTVDLNGDGKIDLVDLEYFVKGYGGKTGENRDTKAHIESFVPVVAIAAETDAHTQVKAGTLQDMLSGKSNVSLTSKEGEISPENPISITFDFAKTDDNVVKTDGIIIETPGDNPIKDAQITVEYTEDGQDYTKQIPVTQGVYYLLIDENIVPERDANGNIRVNLGSQIAVKKVTLLIKGMENNNNLAEISKVEFVNGMADRIPEPEMDRPGNVTATAGSERIHLEWSPCVNITGYEVQIKQGEISESVLTSANSIDIASFGGKGLKNYTEYTLCVQSINGTWRSGYGDSVTATPKPNKKPDKPDNVSAIGNYKSISVSWKDMKDTLSYNLYYKEKSASTYQKITGIEENKYVLTNLADKVEYVLYVTGVNEFGESGPSLLVSAKTTDLEAPKIPLYHLINVGNQGEKGAHIVSAVRRTACAMQNSPLDDSAGSSAWGTVDKDPHSYYQTAGWDEGGFNTLSSSAGLIYEFDNAYKMDTIALYTLPGYDFTYVSLRYWTADGTAYAMTNSYSGSLPKGGISAGSRQDADGRSYRVIKLDVPIEAKKIQLGFGRATASGSVQIGDIYFYYYDTLMEEIMALYADDLHTVLKANVTQADIDRLRVKINEVDEVSGEKHPELEALERELKNAEDILNDVKLKAPVEVHTSITMNEKGKGFSGLNAWQPLGVTALAGETVTIYVGSDKLKTGSAANLRLVATQYHAESSAMAKSVANLKVGANIVQIPKIASFAEQELGGALYIEYTGNNSADRYAVRVSGGISVPKLDLYHVTDAAEKQRRAEVYIQELEEYVSLMEENHKRFHSASGLAYDVQNCVLGASDILMDKMMLSLPATQLLAGAGSGTTAEKAAKVVASMNGMEDMLHLFYQHKGLHVAAIDEVDRLPKSHLNIRYQRMFAGAFMYAAGNHIGIEYGSSALTGGSAATFDEEGKHISGQYFGWGIAHEIGHDINQGAYAVAEITNNYFSVLAQARDTNDSVRFKYRNVYDKVTSGTKGRASNVFTQLGMYWQLHLAYDPGYNYKTYADYNEQLANLFFARVDTYARTTSKAPKAAQGGVDLTLSGGSDQVLMRLSCAAAEKNLLEFFERWGMTPDADTIAYASQFPEEKRAIYYACDDARVYAKTHSGSSLNADGTTEAVGDTTASTINSNAANQVTITLSATLPADDVLGYEITRCMISGGETEKQVVGFATENTFTDTIAAINNRMVWYEVSVIDKYLNRSAAKVLEPLKIEHDGSLDKVFWAVSTTGLTVSGESEETGSSSSDIIHDSQDTAEGNDQTPKSREKLIDRDLNTVYEATAGAQAEILLEFNKTLTVTGFKYTTGAAMPASGAYEILLQSGSTWESVSKGNFLPGTGQTIYFANKDGKYVSTYEASALKLVLTGMSGSPLSIAELDVLGVTGDNVDFEMADENAAVIGKLTADYQFAPDNENGTKNIIPADSLVFMGMYKGNPAYNVVLLYDQDNNLVGSSSTGATVKVEQIILADVPKEGKIENVSAGTWICWIEPDELKNLDLTKITKVRAELYRVNDALTNEGQRLVSDTLFVQMPQTLGGITIDGGTTAQETAGNLSDIPAGDEGTENNPSDIPAGDEGTENNPSDIPAGDEGTENNPSDIPAGDEGTENNPSDIPAGEEGTENNPSDIPAGDEGTESNPSDIPAGDEGTESNPSDIPAGDEGAESNPQESKE